MPTLLWLIPGVFLVWNVYRGYRLFSNYLIARKMGVPVVVIPIGWQDEWWLLSWNFFRWIEHLPRFLNWWFLYSHFAWTQDDRYLSHLKHGDAFVICSPGANEIMINDPDANAEVLAQYKTWIKPYDLYSLFDAFGPTVISVNGEDWQRHRRIINPAFRESNNKLVWTETLRQARQMLDLRVNKYDGQGTLDELRRDSVLIALHVLSAAGFGHSHDFSGGLREIPEGHQKSFSDVLMFLLTNILEMTIFGNIKAPRWLLPAKINDIKDSKEDFRLYMKEAIAYNRATTQGGGGGQSADLVSALIEADEAAKREQKKIDFAGKPLHLTDDELNGNLFVFNLAGFETTANALTYTFPFLTRHPEVQEWVTEEVDQVFSGQTAGETLYENSYPQLIRCLALMYETLRLWGPIPDTSRMPAGVGQTLRVQGKEIFVPPGTFTSTNIYGVHSDPRWWGSDSLEWKPQRWIKVDPVTGKESINPTPSGFPFLGWSHGPRICPGKKFSQVEFVAVISTVLRSYKLEPMLIEGKHETARQARDALLEVVNDSMNMLTPKMRRPQDAGVRFVKR